MIKKGDFIELEYTGRIKTDNQIFDTTDETLAKKEGRNTQGMEFGPITICVGEKNVLPTLDAELEGKEIGKEYKVEVSAENAFGKKDAKLVRIVSRSVFTKQKMNPYPGMQIQGEGTFGVVRSVSGGRVVVDFNHPLSGKDLVYEIKIVKKVEDTEKRVECVSKFNLLPSKKLYSLEIKEDLLKITSKIDIAEDIKKRFEEKLKKLVPKIKKIEFFSEKKDITTEE
jgi:FKBP-type peptidyl-prolyl cis-trans isomerase 2